MDGHGVNVLTPVAAFLIALLVAVWIIPLMIRLAPRIGMIDTPDPRKVHRTPIARVGGIGIALGAISAVLVFSPATDFTVAFIAGALILAAFGAWDDAREIGHYTKFLGQIAAAGIMIFYGGVCIEELPFLNSALPAWIARPFTLVAIVGVINAINHADGLDGLAGGMTLLSVGAMSCIAFMTGNMGFLVFTAAIGGGLLGFIRFNTFPAKVFMGDLGSQFLGFSAAVLAISLTQQVDSQISKSTALLLVGLPVADILAVLYQRIRGGMNWFRATRNHIHHRLLDLGFDHYQAVLVIYSVQALLTVSAIFAAYENDAIILAIYIGACGSVFAYLITAERRGWHLPVGRPSLPSRFMAQLSEKSLLVKGPLFFVQVSVPIYLILTSASLGANGSVPPIHLIAFALILALGVLILFRVPRSSVAYRLALYSSIGMIAYCIYCAPPPLNFVTSVANLAYFLFLAVAISLAASRTLRDDFAVTNMDFLIVLGLVAAEVFSASITGSSNFWTVAIGTALLFYACELIILRSNLIWNRVLGGATAGALGIIVMRFFLLP